MNTVVSVASLASAAAIPSPSSASDELSAPFLDLDRRFSKVYDQWLAQRLLDAARSAAYRAALHENFGGQHTRDQLNDFLKEWHEPDPDLQQWDVINEAMVDVTDEVLSLAPVSSADLALQARAVALRNSESWFGSHGLDAGMRVFIDSAADFLGVALFPGMRTKSLDEIAEDNDQWHAEQERMDALRKPVESAREPVDPVWLAIRKHQKALKRVDAASAPHACAEDAGLNRSALPSKKAEWRRIERRFHRALSNEEKFLVELFETKPTTPLGALALGEYVEARIERERAHEIVPQGLLVQMMRNVRGALTPDYARTIGEMRADGRLVYPEIPDCITFGVAV